MKQLSTTKFDASRQNDDLLESDVLAQTPHSKSIDRRGFLQKVALGVGSAMVAGCGGGSSSDPASVANAARRWRHGGASSASAASAATASPASSTAAAATTSTGTLTIGVNGHWSEKGNYAAPLATQVASLKDLGFTHYRQGIFQLEHAQAIANNIPGMQGIEVLPTIVGESPLSYSDETAAYSANYNLGQNVAKILAGKVPYYELGGEFDALCKVSYDGSTIDQYNQSAFILCRGALRGLIDGIKAVDTKTPIMCGATAGWLHTAFSIALWNGQQPDGTGGHPTVRWDVTMYHWYSEMGNITDAAGVNVLNVLHNAFGKPIWITEFGSRPNNEAAVQSFITNGTVGMPMFENDRSAYNVIGVSWFELYDSGSDPGYGLMSDAQTPKARYNTMKSWLAAHKT
jgi:hypothetical protein